VDQSRNGVRNREYYDLAEVISFITPRMYEVIM